MAWIGFAGVMHGAEVSLSENDTLGTSSFADAGHWDNAAAPSAGNDYFTNSFVLRTPADDGMTYVFGGDSLKVATGGRLLGKTKGTQTIDFSSGDGLILDGGTFDQANSPNDSTQLIVTGKISVLSDSFLGALGSASNDSPNFEVLDVQAPISGAGVYLNIAGTANSGTNSGVVKFSAANPFSGVVTVAGPGNGFTASAVNRLLQLNHLDALQNATILLSSTQPNPLSFAASVNTGNFRIASVGGSTDQILEDTNGDPVTLEIGEGASSDMIYRGAFRGAGGLVKTGTNTMYLLGFDTYTGDTTIKSGVISLDYANFDDGSTVTVDTGAMLDLYHGENDRVAALVLGGVSQPEGIYDATTSPDFISGTGSIEVNTGPAGPQNIVMITSDTGNLMETSFNSDVGHWSSPGAPVSPNHYYTGPYTIRTAALKESGDGGTFAGDSLQIDIDGRFLGKAGASMVGNTVVETITVPKLVLNGGSFYQASAFGSSATLIVNGTMEVKSASVLGALGSGESNSATWETLDIASVISGEGDLTISGSINGGGNNGVVRLSAANPYTGQIAVEQPGNGAIASEHLRLLQLSHPNALQYATLALNTYVPDGISFDASANTAPFLVGCLTGTADQLLADTDGNAVTLNIGGNDGSSDYEGALTGPGSLVKSGTGTITLSGLNTYQGSTMVAGGTLRLESAGLSDSSKVSIAASGILELDHNETDVIGVLVLDGVAQAPGIYNSSNSGGHLTGSGSLQVTATQVGFAEFMNSFSGLSSEEMLPDADPDSDGLVNLMEYALDGFDPVVPNSSATLSSGEISYSKRQLAVENDDVTYQIEISSTLGTGSDPWVVVTPTVNDSSVISYTLPTGLNQIFARLVVRQK
ncbi:autotransporter-associated beta strand repeat-containing protein [Luteolibacter pohnpeiensis]|nr:autotransporter-associated beta strand repeat-containing protein [Luteolibacter pohnpeiensis]